MNLFDDKHDLTMDEVQNAAFKRWSNGSSDAIIVGSINDKQIQKRLRASMVGRWVLNSLTPNSKRELFLEEGLYMFVHNSGDEEGSKERDGPVMLKLIFNKINPDTCVGEQNGFGQQKHHLEEVDPQRLLDAPIRCFINGTTQGFF